MIINPKEIEEAIEHLKETGEIDFKLVLNYLNDIKKSLEGLLLLNVKSKLGKYDLFGDVFEFHIHASKDEYGGYVRLTMNDENIRKKISAMIDDEETDMDQDERMEDEAERNHAIQYQTENSINPNSLVNQVIFEIMNQTEQQDSNAKNISEKELEMMLIKDLNVIEDGMTLIKNQHPVGNGFIDILARDKNGKLCIIELKVVKDCKDIIYQSVYYPTQFEEKVRMITICPDYSNKISKSLNSLKNVEMKQYYCENNEIKIKDII